MFDSLFSLFKPKRVPNEKGICLVYTVARVTDNGYGLRAKISKYNNCYGGVSEYQQIWRKNNGSLYLSIRGYWEGHYYPILDADSEANATNIEMQLDFHTIHYCKIKSSPGHYWYILDFPRKTFSEVMALAKSFHSHDESAFAFFQERKIFTIRAEYKYKMFPRRPVVVSSTNCSKSLERFIDAINDYWVKNETCLKEIAIEKMIWAFSSLPRESDTNLFRFLKIWGDRTQRYLSLPCDEEIKKDKDHREIFVGDLITCRAQHDSNKDPEIFSGYVVFNHNNCFLVIKKEQILQLTPNALALVYRPHILTVTPTVDDIELLLTSNSPIARDLAVEIISNNMPISAYGTPGEPLWSRR